MSYNCQGYRRIAYGAVPSLFGEKSWLTVVTTANHETGEATANPWQRLPRRSWGAKTEQEPRPPKNQPPQPWKADQQKGGVYGGVVYTFTWLLLRRVYTTPGCVVKSPRIP